MVLAAENGYLDERTWLPIILIIKIKEPKHVEYLKLSGLKISKYFNEIVTDDVKQSGQITTNDSSLFNELREKIKKHFRGKIIEGV